MLAWRTFTRRLIAVVIVGSLVLASRCPPTAAGTPPLSTGSSRVGAELASFSAKGASSLGPVAILGTTVFVGAYGSGPGAVYVFKRGRNGWRDVATLRGSGTVTADMFGESLAASGNTLVVGAPMQFSGRPGGAYVFALTPRGWTETAMLKMSHGGEADLFGQSVAICGNTIAVGAPALSAVHVFRRRPTGWHQVQVLRGATNRVFGVSVSLTSQTLVVGDALEGSGRVYVFKKAAATWRKTTVLSVPSLGSDAQLGFSVAASGNTIVAGAHYAANYQGRAYVFSKIGSHWVQTAELTGVDLKNGNIFGNSVAIDGQLIAVGAPMQGSGAVYLYRSSGARWPLLSELGHVVPHYGQFGDFLDLSGGFLAVGASFVADGSGRAFLFAV